MKVYKKSMTQLQNDRIIQVTCLASQPNSTFLLQCLCQKFYPLR